MAVEAMRGCGYRQVDGLYLRCDGAAFGCDRIPVPLHACPICGGGVRQARAHRWLDPAFFGEHHIRGALVEQHSETSASYELLPCPDPALDPVCHPRAPMLLMWVGSRHYTPHTFRMEAADLGVSKRIPAVPKGMKFGETWVLLAHPEAIDPCPTCKGSGLGAEIHEVDEASKCETCDGKGKAPGVFFAFCPTRVELVLRQSDATPERIAEETKRGVTVVAVPDNDLDHNQKEARAAKRAAERVRQEAAATVKAIDAVLDPEVE